MSDDNKDDAKPEGEAEQLTIRVKDQVRLAVACCPAAAVACPSKYRAAGNDILAMLVCGLCGFVGANSSCMTMMNFSPQRCRFTIAAC
jgi:hypothetical protein